jgi:alkylation response protein AidB-like acyl-CoA dehydrogenase
MTSPGSPVADLDLEAEEEFRSSVRAFVEGAANLSATRLFVNEARAYDGAAWMRAASELDAVQVGLPVSAGGHGAGLPITGILFEEFGRSLVPSPLLGTVGLAASVLSGIASDDARERLVELFGGARTATFGWVGETGSWDPSDTPVLITGDGPEVSVSGVLHHVIDGDVADTLYLAGKRSADSGGLSVVAIASGAPGLVTRRLQSLDLTRRLARVELSDVPARVIGRPDEGSAITGGLLSATALLAAESAGAARRAMELTVEYAQLRYQFGRPIGSFQAIKHKCADMLAQVELMSALSQNALRQLDLHGSEAAALVHAAKVYASEAFFDVASEAVQIHGGIGFTWEHDAHLFFRRAKASDPLFGGGAEHRAAIAAAKGWTL